MTPAWIYDWSGALPTRAFVQAPCGIRGAAGIHSPAGTRRPCPRREPGFLGVRRVSRGPGERPHGTTPSACHTRPSGEASGRGGLSTTAVAVSRSRRRNARAGGPGQQTQTLINGTLRGTALPELNFLARRPLDWPAKPSGPPKLVREPPTDTVSQLLEVSSDIVSRFAVRGPSLWWTFGRLRPLGHAQLRET